MFWGKKEISYLTFFDEDITPVMLDLNQLISGMWNNIASDMFAIDILDYKDEDLWYAIYALTIPILNNVWDESPIHQAMGRIIFDRYFEDRIFSDLSIGEFSRGNGKLWLMIFNSADDLDRIVKKLIDKKIDQNKYDSHPKPVFNLITIKLQEQWYKSGKRVVKKTRKYNFDPDCNHPNDKAFLKNTKNERW